MSRSKIGLDSPALAGRLKTYSRRSTYERRPVVLGRARLISDIRTPVAPQPKPAAALTKAAVVRPQPKATPSRVGRSQVLMRRTVSNQMQQRRQRASKNLRGLALASLAAMVFVFGIGVGIIQLTTNQKVEAQVQTLAAKTEAGDGASGSNVPSETPSEESVGSYRVSPQSPRVISIAKIGVEARVLRRGVKANNELKSPANIFDAGWYEGSARPGEQGAVLINGHVHGPTKPGVFFKLKKLTAGDRITIERGDGKLYTYRVVKSQSYDKNNVDMGAAFNSAQPGKPGLNIITCDGEHDADGTYQKRLIVFAVQE